MAQHFLSGVKITAGDENTLYLNTGSTGQETAIFYQVNGSYKFEQRVGANWELYNYTKGNWDFHLQGSTGYLALGHNSPSAGLHVKGTTNLASRFIFTKDLSTDKILFGGADHDNFDTFVGSSSNHSFTITQNGAAAITIDTSKNATFAGDVTIGALTSGETAQLVVNQEGGVAPVAKFMSRTNKAIVQVSDNDTTGYISSENGLFSLGRNAGVNAANININSSHNVGIGTSSPAAKLDVDAGALGSTSGNTKTAAIIRAGRQNLVFKDTRTANDTDWRNATFKVIAQIDSTDHQSIDFVNDNNYAEHIDIRTGNQVFHSRFTANGRLGIGLNNPSVPLHVIGTQIRLDGGSGGFYKYNSSGVFRAAFYDNDTDTKIFADGDGSNPVVTFSSGNSQFAGIVSVPTAKTFRLYNAAGTGWGEIALEETENKVQFNRGIKPSGNNQSDQTLGTSTKRWHTLYAGDGNFSGKVIIPQTATTIGGSNLGNASLLLGSTTTGIGIDTNEIVSKGDHLYIGTATDGKNIIFRTDATSAVLTLDSSQNATFAGRVTIQDTDTESLRINGTNSNGNGSFVRYQTNGTNIGFFGAAYHLIASSPSGYENDFGIRAESDLRFSIGATEKMSLSSSSFNVTPNATFAGSVTASNVHLDGQGDYITFYGGGETNHSITSRQLDGGTGDDIRVNTYGSFIVNLDSNNNQSTAANSSFFVGRHGSNASAISGTNLLFQIDGQTGDVLPGTDNTHDLGSSAKRWQNVVAVNLHGDGSNITNVSATDNTKLPLTGGILTGALAIDDASGNSQFTLRYDTTGDSTIIGDINWNNTAAEGTDDRLGIIRTRTQGGTTSTRGGEMVFYTRKTASGFNTTTYANNGQWTFPHHINLSDNKYLMWGGNAILWHNGSYTYVGDNSTSSALSITGGKLGIGGNPSAKLHVTIPQETDGTVRNELARFTHTSQNTMSIFAYGGSTDLMQIGAWNNEQNISIVTETLSSISATSNKGIYIKSGGNVGIKNTNPIYPLHVTGSAYVNAGSLFIDSGNRLKWGNSNQFIEGTNDTSLEFGTGGSTKMYLNNGGYLGVGTTSPLEKLHVMYSDTAGIATTYSKGIIEDTDAQLDLLSTSDGTWGSSINLVESAGGNANTDVWSIARKTTGGVGDSSLNFNFGTNNQHDNTRRVAFSSAGNITMGGDLTVEGGQIYINDTNTKLEEGNGNAFRITTNSGYGEFGPMNTGHCHIQTDRTNFYFNKQIQVDTGIISSYNEDLSLRRAVSDAGSINLNIGMLYSKEINDSQLQLGGFTINTALEDAYHCYIPGISPNEFAGAHRKLTVTATKNGTSITATDLANAFLAHEETYSLSTANTDTLIIEIAGWGLNYGQWYGITFGSAQWRAKDIDIEISSDNGANYTTIYSENNQPHATVRTYHAGNNTNINKIRYTLTNWNTTSTRINHIFGYKYLESDTNYLDKFRDESIYGNMNWKDNYPATFGNSGDLVIKHTGSDSIIETHASLSAGDLYIKSQGTNHDLYLQAADDIFIRPQNGESGIRVIGNGQVELYHDNDLRLSTTSTGARFTKQQNAGSRLELYNNRQDAGNVEVYRIAAYNSVEVAGVHFYRGGGGSSGYTKIFAKKNNASSLEEVVQFGTNDSLLTEFAGDVKINGDLNITGDINSVNVTNLDVDDKTITIAQGAADSSAADGAGIVVDGASASLLYDHTGTQWESNKTLEVQGQIKSNTAEAQLELISTHGRTSYINQGGGNLHIKAVHGSGVGINYGDTNNPGLLRLYNNTTAKVTLNATTGSGEFAGNVTHAGLTMTDGTSVDQVKDFAMTFQLVANTWTDTGIDSTDLATGTYAMQAYVSDFSVGGGHYYEYYSAMVSWYGQGTNSTHVDEIPIHRAGHAPNNGDVQFRTQRHASGNLMLQVKHNLSYSGALDNSSGGKIFRFKFRRLI